MLYAVPTIVGELKRHFRDQGWSIRVPRGIQETQRRLEGETLRRRWARGMTTRVSRRSRA